MTPKIYRPHPWQKLIIKNYGFAILKVKKNTASNTGISVTEAMKERRTEPGSLKAMISDPASSKFQDQNFKELSSENGRKKDVIRCDKLF